MYAFIRFLVVIILVSTCSGCFSNPDARVVRLDEVRGAPPNYTIIEKNLTKEELERALAREDLTEKVRVLQIFGSSGAPLSGFPEYRLFDIEQGSIYQLLGLVDADVLVACNDYVVFNPLRFKDFVRLIPSLSEATIEVRRFQRPLLFRYHIGKMGTVPISK